jgi:hypothetical protein
MANTLIYVVKIFYINQRLLVRVRVMVFNSTFNNIYVISWQTVLLVEETGISGENHKPAVSN